MYSLRDGNKIYLIVLTGMYFDDPATWADLVEEKLESFSAYDPASSTNKSSDSAEPP